MTFAIPDMSRQLHMPFSQISTDAYADKEAASGIIVSPASWSNNLTNLNKMFDEASREGKEERLIATGNLLAAFDGLSGKGQIVQFADINGDVKPGILLPRAYSTEQFLKERRVRFQTGDQVIRFLKESEDKKITTADDVMTVSQRYDGGYEFRARRAGSRAASISPTARCARSSTAGSSAAAHGSHRQRADRRRLIEAMQEIGAKWVASDEQDLAHKIVNPKD